MTTFVDGLIALLNGLLTLLGHVLNLTTGAAIVLAVGLGWLALLEIDRLNRQGTKPVIGRH